MDSLIIEKNLQLLKAIVSGDYDTYSKLCSQDITCFEPETQGHLTKGQAFHRYYFDLPTDLPTSVSTHKNVSMSGTHVKWLGEKAAVVSYNRLDQVLTDDGPITKVTSETRVWELCEIDGQNVWQNVHFHRS